jgi:hypothetical protein
MYKDSCIKWIQLAQDGILWGFGESSSSVKGEKFVDQLSGYRFVKQDFVPWSWLLKLMILVAKRRVEIVVT